MKVPAIVTLYFKETDEDSGLLKIYREEDSWTLEGKSMHTIIALRTPINDYG
jgi:hypothetical protein